MAGVSFDASEVRAYADHLATAGRRLRADVEPVVSKGALNIKKQLVEEMSVGYTGPKVARTISYDITSSGDTVEAEIGPVTGGAGSLANLMYFGTSKGGGQIPDPIGALQAEVPRFEKALLDVMEQAVT